MMKLPDNTALCTQPLPTAFVIWCGELVSHSDNTQKYFSLTILWDFYPHLNPGLRAVDPSRYHRKISYRLFPKQFQPSWFSFIHTNAALQFCITNTQWNFPSHLYSSLSRAGHPLQHLCCPHNPHSSWFLLSLWRLTLESYTNSPPSHRFSHKLPTLLYNTNAFTSSWKQTQNY